LTSRTALIHPNHEGAIAADAYEVIDLTADRGGVHALIATPTAGPRLLRLQSTGDAKWLDTPPAGSGVHEYGLGALAAAPNGAVALLRPGDAIAWLDGEAADITALGDVGKLGDPAWCDALNGVIVVAEREQGRAFPAAALTSVTRSGAVRDLWTGSDFITRPTVSSGGTVAFMTWDLPWMPWETSSIQVGILGPDGLEGMCRAPTPADAAVAQPQFGPHGELYFLCDATGFFELWTSRDGHARPVTQLGADIGLSLSRQTGRSWAFTTPGTAAAVTWRRGRSCLVEIDLASGCGRTLETPEPPADLLAAADDDLWYASLPVEGPMAIRLRDRQGDRAVWTAPADPVAFAGPAPRALSLATSDGGEIDAFHFPARAEQRKGLTVLNLHGGPKSLAPLRLKGALRVLRNEGYDIVELNYRGSAGFGRAYRNRLDGQWGIADSQDVLKAAEHIESLGIAPRHRIVLRGPSAGGFTALNVVAQEPGFAGAISYFGVSDLRRLGATTHKFEAGYLKTLVGSSNLDDAVFAERSPITRADQITAPVLLLQGTADRVNPPEQSIELASRIRAAGGRCGLHLFEGEGHGFARLDTLNACLDFELAFLRELT